MDDVKWHQVKEESTCAICKDILSDPRILPCHHYFCTSCLRNLVKSQPASKCEFPCPLCRRSVVLSIPNAVEELPSYLAVDYHVETLFAQAIQRRLVQRAQEHLQIHGGTPICRNCGEDEAKSFCISCSQFLCNICAKDHARSSNTKEHPMYAVSMQDHTSNHALVSPPHLPRRPKNCPVHPEVPLELYCKCEDVLICQECTITNHVNHDYDKITDVIDNERKKLTEALPGIKNVIDEVEGAISGVKNIRKEVKYKEKESFQKLDDVFDSLHAALDERKKQLQHQIQQDAAEKDKGFEVKENELCFVLNRLKDCWWFIDATLKENVHQDVLTMKRLMLQWRDTLKERAENLIPIIHQNFPIILNVTDIKNQIMQYGSFCDPRKCVIIGIKASVPVGLANSFKVLLKDLFGNEICSASPADIRVLVQYEKKAQLTDCEFEVATLERVPNSTMFEGSYLCKGGTSHSVSVLVKGEHIYQSPFK